MQKDVISYLVCKYVPPDRHELIAEFQDIMAAEWRVYQLESQLTPEEKEQGIFHCRWIRLHTEVCAGGGEEH